MHGPKLVFYKCWSIKVFGQTIVALKAKTQVYKGGEHAMRVENLK